jgi:D-proline reductase (dithiol) PrdB
MTADDALRARADQLPIQPFANPVFTVPPPLRDATVAIVTTAGLRAPGQPDFRRQDESFRVLDAKERRLTMGHVSLNFDRSGFSWDLNVVYPIDRLHELAAAGTIGAVAPRMLSFMGALNETMATLRLDTGRAAARLLRDDGVDVVLLTGV